MPEQLTPPQPSIQPKGKERQKGPSHLGSGEREEEGGGGNEEKGFCGEKQLFISPPV